MSLNDFYPAVEVLLNLEPEIAAQFLLKHLCALSSHPSGRNGLNWYNYTLNGNFESYTRDSVQQEAVGKLLVEAWVWLEREGMLAPQPNSNSARSWSYVTKKGLALCKDGDFEKYRRSLFLPSEGLEPVLAEKVLPLYRRGDYDTAIFQAVKELEVRVRDQSKLSNDKVGVDLMRLAFNHDSGRLKVSDKASEQQGVADLFAGVVGWVKNPLSHRDVNYGDPLEAAEIIMFVNYLLRLLNRATSRG